MRLFQLASRVHAPHGSFPVCLPTSRLPGHGSSLPINKDRTSSNWWNRCSWIINGQVCRLRAWVRSPASSRQIRTIRFAQETYRWKHFPVALPFAASPLVGAALIPLGIMRHSAWKSFLSLHTSKLVWILSVLYAARASHQIIVEAVGEKSVLDGQNKRPRKLARRVKGFLSKQPRNSSSGVQGSGP